MIDDRPQVERTAPLTQPMKPFLASEIRKAFVQMNGARVSCHNGQTADPRNHYAKEMKSRSGKRKK